MAVLELGAVNLDHGARVPKQDFGGRLHQPCLAGSCRSQQKEVGDRAARRRKTRHVSLIDSRQLPNGTVLSYDSAAQLSLETFRLERLPRGIKNRRASGVL